MSNQHFSLKKSKSYLNNLLGIIWLLKLIAIFDLMGMLHAAEECREQWNGNQII
jgi:hypothetical protein